MKTFGNLNSFSSVFSSKDMSREENSLFEHSKEVLLAQRTPTILNIYDFVSHEISMSSLDKGFERKSSPTKALILTSITHLHV